MKDKKQLNFPVPLEMWKRLVRLSQERTDKEGKMVSLASLIREAIEKYLEENEKRT